MGIDGDPNPKLLTCNRARSAAVLWLLCVEAEAKKNRNATQHCAE